MELAAGLDRALRRAGIPIIGVKIRVIADRAQWVIEYAPEATFEHRTAGAAIVASYDPANDPTGVDEQAAARVDDDKLFKALVIVLAQRFGVSAVTLRNQIIAAYRNL